MGESKFVQTLKRSAGPGLVSEIRDRGDERRLARSYVVSGGALVTLRDLWGGLLKWFARALYLAPVLVLAKLATSGAAAAVAVAAFVCIVLAFFVVLCLYIVAAFIAWGQAARSRLVRPEKNAHPRDASQVDTQDLGRTVTVRGRVVRLRGASPALITDWWSAEDRETTADVFGVLREDGLPVIVLPTTAPTLVAPKGIEGGDPLLDQRALSEGDEIVLTGQLLDRIANVHAFELDGEVLRIGGDAPDEAAPYRATLTGGGLLVSDRPDAPLLIDVVTRPTRALTA